MKESKAAKFTRTIEMRDGPSGTIIEMREFAAARNIEKCIFLR